MKLVLVALANFANRYGKSCFPGQVTLARMTGLKERAIRTALFELEEAGLIERTSRRYKGRATTDSYRLFCGENRLKHESANDAVGQGQPADAAGRETPQPAFEAIQPADDAPSQPASDNISDKPITIRSVRSYTSVDPNTPGEVGHEFKYPADFQKFWDSFPRKDGKREALRAWQKLTRGEKTAALADVPSRVVHNWAGRETEKIPHASTYLNQHRWEDDIMTNLIGAPARKIAPDLSPGQELLRQMHLEAVDRERTRNNRNREPGQSALAAPNHRPDGGRGVH
jgi:hypothetical protein